MKDRDEKKKDFEELRKALEAANNIFVNGFEKITNSTGSEGTHGYVAVMQLGIAAAAIKGLEIQVQQLARRVAELERR